MRGLEAHAISLRIATGYQSSCGGGSLVYYSCLLDAAARDREDVEGGGGSRGIDAVEAQLDGGVV